MLITNNIPKRNYLNELELTSEQFVILKDKYLDEWVTSLTPEDKEFVVTNSQRNYLNKLTNSEVIEELDWFFGSELMSIIETVKKEVSPANVTITDDDYADKVDTLVDNMKMTEYKFDEQFYNEIVINDKYRFPRFNETDYPIHLSQS